MPKKKNRKMEDEYVHRYGFGASPRLMHRVEDARLKMSDLLGQSLNLSEFVRLSLGEYCRQIEAGKTAAHRTSK